MTKSASQQQNLTQSVGKIQPKKQSLKPSRSSSALATKSHLPISRLVDRVVDRCSRSSTILNSINQQVLPQSKGRQSKKNHLQTDFKSDFEDKYPVAKTSERSYKDVAKELSPPRFLNQEEMDENGEQASTLINS